MEKVKEPSTTKKEAAYYTDRREFRGDSATSVDGNSLSVNKKVKAVRNNVKVFILHPFLMIITLITLKFIVILVAFSNIL